MNRQPFNLSQALAGKPFTNDKGWTVEDWHYFKDNRYPVYVKWEHIADYVDNLMESELFMLPEKKKVWIVVYNSSLGILTTTFESLFYAMIKKEDLGDRYLETIEKEYEL